eukprot:m.812346 g.812346  ORF g.812346 m.812346 type:complete len:81 (+) comp59341_c0_seq4:971-1213(+)
MILISQLCDGVLQIAAGLGHVDILRFLLSLQEFKIRLNDRNRMTYKTALFCAVEEGRLDCLELLLAAGANPSVVGNGRRS